jgi:predicted amidohydrolase
MNKFKVALLQLMPTDRQSGNLEKGIRYCGLAKELGADVALFPEMWNVGYSFPSEHIKDYDGVSQEEMKIALDSKKVKVSISSQISYYGVDIKLTDIILFIGIKYNTIIR